MLVSVEDGDAAEVEPSVLLDGERDDREALERIPIPPSLLLYYALVHYGQLVRIGICNICHRSHERLARWLLMAHDLTQGDTFLMTREFLGMMLEMHPASVSRAAKLLQKLSLIRYEHGQITVTDRLGLEAAACECYGAMRHALECLQEQRTRSPHSLCN
jgi:hypothetical protein